jgi:hypothetical protein
MFPVGILMKTARDSSADSSGSWRRGTALTIATPRLRSRVTLIDVPQWGHTR